MYNRSVAGLSEKSTSIGESNNKKEVQHVRSNWNRW